MNKGLELIAKERERQSKEEGWTKEHDDSYRRNELALAAACYAAVDQTIVNESIKIYKCLEFCDGYRFKDLWPWADKYDKRKKHSYQKRLIIAGALIVAELDRLERSKNENI